MPRSAMRKEKSVRREDLFERGLDERQVSRLSFVRWSLYAGYAQFHEWITSDAPVVRTTEREMPVTASRREEMSMP
jgi:hypothetical protein